MQGLARHPKFKDKTRDGYFQLLSQILCWPFHKDVVFLNLIRCADSLTLILALKQFPKLQLPTMHAEKTTEK